jgi:Na+/proline symporter
VIAAIQTVLTYLMLPGLIVAAGVGSLWPAAVVNALIHFGLCFIALRFLSLFRKKRIHD